MIATTPLPPSRKQFTLDLNDEIIFDGFAGGGGASWGILMALGRHVDVAVNHNKWALGMHRINHPQTLHLCEDIWGVDPRVATGGRPVGFAWFSPDCKHFSKAKGGKPLSKKIRALVLVILRWAASVRPRVIAMENVEEITTYGPLKNGRPDPRYKGRTWQAFISILSSGIDPKHPDLPMILKFLRGTVTKEQCVRGFGYNVEGREIRAHVHGTGTIRKRYYMVARCDGRPIVWPEPTHALPDEPRSKRLERARFIAEEIDWTIPVNSIFLTKRQARKAGCRRPLVKATKSRIAKGIDLFVLKEERPFLVSFTHQGGDRIEDVLMPAKTITAARRGEKGLVDMKLAPFLTEHANASTQRVFRANQPLRTLCAEVKRGHFVLGAATLIKLRGDPKNHPPGHKVDQPAHTISAGGTHLGVLFASLVAYYGTETDGQRINTPLRSVTGKARFGMAVAEGAVQPLTSEQLRGAKRCAKFLRDHGVKFEGEFATVGDYVIVDIGIRMLTPRELFRAQGFPDSYVIDRALLIGRNGRLVEKPLSKSRQINMCGNSVCPPVAAALTAANVPELAVWRNGERKRFEKYLRSMRNALN